MQADETLTSLRAEARAFEETIPALTRKALGQFFTGIKLGRVLAHLAIEESTRRIIDPMAGTGDLLDAAYEVVNSRAMVLEQLEGVEIDPEIAKFCERRLKLFCARKSTSFHILNADIFDPTIYDQLHTTGYDLVIANPPYVRYQVMDGRIDKVRHSLRQIVTQRLSGATLGIWQALVGGYPGLADLSVPAWLLCSLLVKTGGYLAIVAPATWRSRFYANIIRYLLIRCFSLEFIIEDTQPGWFSDALVRTHLIIARRLSDENIAKSLVSRKVWPEARWIQVTPDAASSKSLVGGAFDTDSPEAAFAFWCRSGDISCPVGIKSRRFSLEDEWASLRFDSQGSDWFIKLEPEKPEIPLFSSTRGHAVAVPEGLRDLTPKSIDPRILRPLEEVGVHIGQGLRTGCNRFFYVHVVEKAQDGLVTVITNSKFGSKELQVPENALRPVLHRQADLKLWQSGEPLTTHALYLRNWVLPEDFETVRATIPAYEQAGEKPPQIMPDELAEYVRTAGNQPLEARSESKPVSEFSAVRTNTRPAGSNTPPRFWYMLPNIMPRHLPNAFIPRVLHNSPQIYGNTEPPVLIDANFSTLWSQQSEWKTSAMIAFLNSVWCRVVMEATGTPLGGGALKLEAIHLRRMLVPKLHPSTLKKLAKSLHNEKSGQRQRLVDRTVLGTLLPTGTPRFEIDVLASALYNRLGELRAARQSSTP